MSRVTGSERNRSRSDVTQPIDSRAMSLSNKSLSSNGALDVDVALLNEINAIEARLVDPGKPFTPYTMMDLLNVSIA